MWNDALCATILRKHLENPLPNLRFVPPPPLFFQSGRLCVNKVNVQAATEILKFWRTTRNNRSPFSANPNIWLAITTEPAVRLRPARAQWTKTKRWGFVLNLIAHNMNLKSAICMWKRLTYVSCKRHILNRFSTLNGNIKEYHSALCCRVYTLGRPYALFIFLFRSSRRYSLIDKWQCTAAVSQHSERWSVLICTSYLSTHSAHHHILTGSRGFGVGVIPL